MILAIDAGSSTTDVVLVEDKKIAKSYSFSNFRNNQDNYAAIIENIKQNITDNQLQEIRVTGCGYGNVISMLNRYFNISGRKEENKINPGISVINEITAIGRGGLFAANCEIALVVSLGSGTCMVSAHDDGFNGSYFKHVGGTAIGGRTLTGLGKLLLNVDDFAEIENMAKNGNLENVDLALKNIYPKGIGILPNTATASHFGNISDNTTKEDIALALVNMVAQSIGSIASFAAKAYGHDSIVLTGKLAKIGLIQRIIRERISSISSIPVVIPNNAEIATAIGAGLGRLNN